MFIEHFITREDHEAIDDVEDDAACDDEEDKCDRAGFFICFLITRIKMNIFLIYTNNILWTNKNRISYIIS